MSLPKQKTQATAANNYATVKKEIEEDRLHAWSSASTFLIGEFEVSPLTLRSECDLSLSNNAVTNGMEITDGDLAAYIWRHLPDFGDEIKRKQFIKKFSAAKDKEGMVNDCLEHYTEAFEDTPNSSSFGGTHRNSTLPSIPSIAFLCDEYGSAYGIDLREVADIDLRIVFQACRAIRMRTSDAKYSEPKRLRSAKSELLKAHG